MIKHDLTQEQKDNIREWVKALRSGDYKQGNSLLRQGDRFCCLGVACDLYDDEQWIENNNGVKLFLEAPIVSYPPKVVAKHFGLNDRDPIISQEAKKKFGIEGDRTISLSVLNDDEGFSFNKIADVIEFEFLSQVNEAKDG